MLKAKHIMTSEVVTVDLDDTVDYAVSLLVKHRISGLPVLDKAKCLVGIISEFDLLELICDTRAEKGKVCHYMSTEVCKVSEDADWSSVVNMFRASQIRRLPVTRDEKLVGIISRHDLMRVIQDARKRNRQELSQAVVPRRRLNCRVLLAEDGSANGRFLSLVLKKAGADVTIAQNGQIAVDKVLAALPEKSQPDGDKTGPFDLILMDMQMPVMDGREATRRLRQEGYAGPIIALTAHAEEYDRQKCLEAGCDDHLTKPIDRNMLLEVVASHIEKQRPESRQESCSA